MCMCVSLCVYVCEFVCVVVVMHACLRARAYKSPIIKLPWT